LRYLVSRRVLFECTVRNLHPNTVRIEATNTMSVFLAESRKRNRVNTAAYTSNAPFKIFINSLSIFYIKWQDF